MSDSSESRLGKRLGWFALLWIAGVAAVSSLAYAIRFVIGIS